MSPLETDPATGSPPTEWTAPTVPTEPTGSTPGSGPGRGRPREFPVYLWSAGLTVLALTWIMKLWRADLAVPFWYSGPALAGASLFKSISATGWYTFQPNLGAPYGQFYSDATSPGDLNVIGARVVDLFIGNWAVALNIFFLLGFVACALTAVWFLRTCRVGPWFSVTAAVLFAVAPYHFLKNENQLFLASYFCVPLASAVVLRATRAQGLWGRRATGRPHLSAITGRGVGTVLILVVVAGCGTDYALFTALLLAFAGAFGLVRSWNRSRMIGLLAAEATLVVAFLLNSLPQLVRWLGSGGIVTPNRLPGAEGSEFKLASLVFPAPGYPVAYLARMRGIYDRNYPVPGETPALGAVAAVGLLILMVVAVTALTGRHRAGTSGWTERHGLLLELSFLTLFAFALGVVGGLGTLISHLAEDYSGWGRICIFISLFALTAVGICADEAMQRLRSRRSGGDQVHTRPDRRGGRSATRIGEGAAGRMAGVGIPGVAVIVLILGLADQSLTGAVPAYAANAAQYRSDAQFVGRVQAAVPTDAMIFQLPYAAFSDTGSSRYPPAADQFALWLHSSTLRWSGGGISGRPQTNWPARLVTRSPSQMLQGLSAIGFSGITIDRTALADRGARWISQLRPELGGPKLASQDGRYLYYSLAPAIKILDASTTKARRAAIAAASTGITGTTS